MTHIGKKTSVFPLQASIFSSIEIWIRDKQRTTTAKKKMEIFTRFSCCSGLRIDVTWSGYLSEWLWERRSKTRLRVVESEIAKRINRLPRNDVGRRRHGSAVFELKFDYEKDAGPVCVWRSDTYDVTLGAR